APWSVLEDQKRKATGDGGSRSAERTEEEVKMSRALEKVAGEVGVRNLTSVAIAYVMQKTTNVFPIIGGRKIEHLKDNIEALDISLSAEQIKYLDSINPFDPGFPSTMIGDGTEYNRFLASTARMAKQPLAPPIKP
ncbi:hypothetical protein CPB85DRAFT_1227944, partial [Mucidula mucida]